MRSRITQRAVEALRLEAMCQSRELIVWDDVWRGLGAKATSKGSVSFILQKSIRNKSKRITLGHWPWLTVRQAQSQAAIALGRLHSMEAITPSAPLPAHNSISLQRAFDLFVTRKSEPNKRHWRELQRAFNVDIIPTLPAALTNITKQDLRKLLNDKEDTAPIMALQLYKYLSPFFKFCVEQDYITHNPLANLTPPKSSKARKRYLTKDEIRLYWQAGSMLPDPHSSFYKIALLTGARNRTELALMQWNEIDFEERIWTIPNDRSKNGELHMVYLCDLALKEFHKLSRIVIRDTLRHKARSSPYVFASNKGARNKPINNFGDIHKQFLAICPLADFTLHDLRRTMMWHLTNLGVSEHVSDLLLNHVKSGMRKVYNQFDYFNERCAALRLYGELVEDIIASR